MTEEVTSEVQETVEVDPIQERAMQSGWKPLEEWDGDPSDWRDPKAFIDRGELLSEIHKQKRTVKELRVILDDLKSHVNNMTKQQYDNYERALKNKRKELIDNGESSEVDKVDRMIDEVKKNAPRQQQGPSVKDQERIAETFSQFKKSNPWFETDPDLTQEANKISQYEMARIQQEYQSQGVNKTYFTPDEAEEIFDSVSKEIKKRYPDKFRNKKKDNPPSVEGSTNRQSSSKAKSSMKDVPEEYRAIVKKFVRQGIMTESEYVDMLKSQGVI